MFLIAKVVCWMLEIQNKYDTNATFQEFRLISNEMCCCNLILHIFNEHLSHARQFALPEIT